MFGFLIGIASLAGLIFTLRSGPGRHGRGFGRGFGVQRFMLHRLFQELDATPGQEKVLRQAFEQLMDTMTAQKAALERSRQQIARAVAGPVFDEEGFGAAYATQDEAVSALRSSLMEGLGRAHEALEPEQRKRLAELIEKGPRHFGSFRGFGRFNEGSWAGRGHCASC